METRPPEVIDRWVRALTPPASREHVLGDLRERYVSPRQYLLDALSTIPFIIWSRVRRTANLFLLLLLGGFLWWAVFWGPKQEHWLAATIPTFLTVIVLTLRDVYRGADLQKWKRTAAIDIALAAAAVLLSQGVLYLLGSPIRLAPETLLVGFPLGFIMLFFVRLQSPSGFQASNSYTKEVSIDELRTEISLYEKLVRRAIRIELGACVVVCVCFSAYVLALPMSSIGKVGSGLVAAGAAFVAWFMLRYLRVREIPQNLSFADTLTAYRSELERRYRLSKTYVWWYVTPIALGIGVMMAGPKFQTPGGLVPGLLTVAVLIVVGAALTLAQRAAAAVMQRRVEQLANLHERAPQAAAQ